MGDIDIAVVDSLKVLDPRRPIREADILDGSACLRWMTLVAPGGPSNIAPTPS